MMIVISEVNKLDHKINMIQKTKINIG